MAVFQSRLNKINRLLFKAFSDRLTEVRQEVIKIDGNSIKNNHEPADPFESSLTGIAQDKDFLKSCEADISLEPPAPSFLKELSQKKEKVISLLKERYEKPKNIKIDSELPVSEWLLCQLMVVHRPKLDRRLLKGLLLTEILVKLNLVAIKSITSNDMRYLDSLNYYYELLPKPDAGDHSKMYESFLRLYIRALEDCKQNLEEA
ncbi:MAG: hypothetical protein ACQ9MH_12865 [Nitrospinales bacterium]